MTTIATDGKTVAADGQRTLGSERISMVEKKLRMKAGRIYAITGTFAFFDDLIMWHIMGARVEDVPKGDGDNGWSLLVIEPGATGVHRYTSECPRLEIFPYPATFGSGADYAMGAMCAGADPREAVTIASRLDINTGGEIQVIDIAAEFTDIVPFKAAAE